jgi:uncharacterized protein with GYD domain
MATYVLLTTLTAEGVRTVKRDPGRIDEVNREVERLGVTVREQWAILGAFDFLTIVEASDPRTMLRLSLELGSRGTARCRSVAAIPIDEFVAAL